MLQFFRKNQKILFLVITIAVITSFVFFGTYQAFVPASKKSDKVVYKTLDGKKIRESYLAQLTHFLKNEAFYGITPQNIFQVNYLNNGIITRDFLESGLAPLIVGRDPERYTTVLQEKLERERGYRPFEHAYVSKLKAMEVWSLFAPDMIEMLDSYRSSEDALTSLEKKVELYLKERRFPPSMLAQMLRYQEQEYGMFPKDNRLAREEISLFGYHNLADWFSDAFVEDVAMVITKMAAEARHKGYRVSKAEIMSDISHKTHVTYDALKKQIGTHIPSPHSYYTTFLQQTGYDEETLVQIVGDIMLYQRMLSDVAAAPLVDTLPMEKFHTFANEYATFQLTQMPKQLRFTTYEELKEFESYLALTAGEQQGVQLPSESLALEHIERVAPDLVGERYSLYVGSVDKRALESKVSVKETWEWEQDPAHATLLKEQFPYLNVEDKSVFAAIEEFEAAQRAKVDAFARRQIVEKHPEWVSDALREVDMDTVDLFLTKNGAMHAIEGISDIKAMLALVWEQDEVFDYTQDKRHYFRLLVRERPQKRELLTFREAKKSGALDKVVSYVNGDKLTSDRLDTLYVTLRERGVIDKTLGFAEKKEMLPAYRFYFDLTRERSEEGFSEQWNPDIKDVTITRQAPTFLTFDEVVKQEPDLPSKVAVAEGEGAYFYTFLDKKVDSSLPVEKISKAQELLSNDLKMHYIREVLDRV